MTIVQLTWAKPNRDWFINRAMFNILTYLGDWEFENIYFLYKLLLVLK